MSARAPVAEAPLVGAPLAAASSGRAWFTQVPRRGASAGCARPARPECLFRSERLLAVFAVAQLDDLHRVERRSLAQILGHHPDVEAVLHRLILPSADDIHHLLAGPFPLRDLPPPPPRSDPPNT